MATAFSVAIHIACFMMVDWLLIDRGEQSETHAVLMVTLQSPETPDGSSDQPPAHRAPATGHAEESGSGGELPASRAIAEASRTPLASRPRAVEHAETDQAPAELQTSTVSAADTTVAQADVVTTTSESSTAAVTGAQEVDPAALEQAPLSPKQAKMLKRKFKRWTENFHRMAGTEAGLTWRHKGQEYVAQFTQLPAADDMGIERVVVEVSTEENGKRLSTEMRMKKLAFSNYAQFVHRWDPNVQIHDDQFDGRFHANSEINLAYTRKVRPQFHGEVTTSARRVNVTESRGLVRRDEIFMGGLRTRVRAISLPKHYLPFPQEADLADDQVQRFDADTRITFFADGGYGWQAMSGDAPQHVASLSDSPTYLIAAEDVRLHVKGTVNGKVLVYSPARIVIEGDLAYAEHPAEVAGADDYLGLAANYVDIAPPGVTGPGDLVIHAAIYAKRRFAVRRYRSRGKGLLHIYGSVTAGALSATEPRFRTRIQFDPRLEQQRPPGFPTTNRYEVESADLSWRVERLGAGAL